MALNTREDDGTPSAALSMVNLQNADISSEDRVIHVSFREPFDKNNPQQWSMMKKCAATATLSLTGFNRIMVSTIMAPALSTIKVELGLTNLEANMALSIYILATAFGPLIFGPLSELFGREWVLHSTNIWFLIFNIVCGFARNKSALIGSRFLAGLGASAVYSLAASVLSDIWTPAQRGKTIGLYMVVPLLGAATGPILGGYVADHTTWRWIFWSTSLLQGFMVLMSFVMFRETNAFTILTRRAKKLQKHHCGPTASFVVASNIPSGVRSERNTFEYFASNLSRPIKLLLSHPIVQLQALLAGLSYGLTYLVLSSYADIYQSKYKVSTSTSSLHYLSLCIGELSGAALGGPLMDMVFRRLQTKMGTSRSSKQGLPELHVPMMLPGALSICAGLLIYGWSAERKAHWTAVDFGGILFTFGSQICSQALQAYTIDCFPAQAGSATAAVQLFRSLGAFTFPLFSSALYERLGYGKGNTVLAAIWTCFGICIPAIFWLHGRAIRLRYKHDS